MRLLAYQLDQILVNLIYLCQEVSGLLLTNMATVRPDTRARHKRQ